MKDKIDIALSLLRRILEEHCEDDTLTVSVEEGSAMHQLFAEELGEPLASVPLSNQVANIYSDGRVLYTMSPVISKLLKEKLR